MPRYSAVVLFFTTISFFVKFGIFIGVTIALSTFYSFGLFVVMLAFVGRNESKNDFASFWNWIRCKGETWCLHGHIRHPHGSAMTAPPLIRPFSSQKPLRKRICGMKRMGVSAQAR